jgi:DinB superfamily
MIDPPTLLASARAELARLPSILDALLEGVDAATWRERPAPDEWSPIEIVCHLRDEEAEDFGARLRVVVEGGTTFAPIDPAPWVEERGYRDADPEAALAAFRERRAATLAFLTAVSSERLRHALPHPRLGTLSGMDLLAAWVTHDRLHLGQLAATLARLGARRWAPLRVEYAGPIPYAESPVQ